MPFASSRGMSGSAEPDDRRISLTEGRTTSSAPGEAAIGPARHCRVQAGEGPIMPGLTAEAPARAVGRYQLDTEVGRLTPKSGRITAEHGL
jgi:hypothetical protein